LVLGVCAFKTLPKSARSGSTVSWLFSETILRDRITVSARQTWTTTEALMHRRLGVPLQAKGSAGPLVWLRALPRQYGSPSTRRLNSRANRKLTHQPVGGAACCAPAWQHCAPSAVLPRLWPNSKHKNGPQFPCPNLPYQEFNSVNLNSALYNHVPPAR
jgi:hypothetical protein